MPNSIESKEILRKVGYKLGELRHAKREKINVAAKELGLSASTLSKIENGLYDSISVILLAKMAAYYGTSAADILAF